METKDPYTTLKIRASTKKALLKMQALYQLQHGEKITVDMILKTFIENQPRVNLKGKAEMSLQR